MAKTNFTKVEASVEAELKRQQVESLIKKTEYKQEEGEKTPKTYLIASIKSDLKILAKHSRKLSKKVGITKKEIKSLISKPHELKDEDWQLLEDVKKKLDRFKEEIADELPSASDEDLINQEKEKHINKRFNVSDKWLPLH